MQQYFIASFITLPDKLINFRNKYYFKADLVLPHVTFVFPFTFEGEIRDLENHIETTIKGIDAFNFSLESFSVSFDNHVFLDFQKGRENIQKIHDNLYTEILTPFLRKDIPYSPHITIATCNEENRNKILNELQGIFIPFKGKVESISLMKIPDRNTPRESVKEFKL